MRCDADISTRGTVDRDWMSLLKVFKTLGHSLGLMPICSVHHLLSGVGIVNSWVRSLTSNREVRPRVLLPRQLGKSVCLRARKNRLMDYNSMAKRSMELVLFTLGTQKTISVQVSLEIHRFFD